MKALTSLPNAARLSRAIEILAAKGLPTEICLFQAGLSDTTKGVFRFDEKSAASVMEEFNERGVKCRFDYEHASSMAPFANDPAEAGKAAGWCSLEIRDGACWATEIEWTPAATEKLKAKEFRYVSPEFGYEDDGSGGYRVTSILSIALTNSPATKNAEPIVASTVEVKEQRPMKSILTFLGLADNAPEVEALSALSRMKESLTQILGLSGKASPAEALGVFQAWKASHEQVATLTAKVTELETAQAKAKLDTLIETAKKDGRLPPAAEQAARDLAKHGIASLSAFLDAMPKVKTTELRQPEGGAAGTETLSAAEVEWCGKFGVDPKKYAERKAAEAAEHAKRTARA